MPTQQPANQPNPLNNRRLVGWLLGWGIYNGLITVGLSAITALLSGRLIGRQQLGSRSSEEEHMNENMNHAFTSQRVVGLPIDPRLVRVGDIIVAYPDTARNADWRLSYSPRRLIVHRIDFRPARKRSTFSSTAYFSFSGPRYGTDRPDMSWDISSGAYNKFVLIGETILPMFYAEPEPPAPACHGGCCGCCPAR